MSETPSDTNAGPAPNMTPVKYRHSGNLGSAPIVYVLLTVLAFAIPCYLYGMVTASIMSVKMKIMITIFLSIGLGWTAMWLGQRFHCRSVMLVTFATTLGVAAGMYVGIATFMESVFAIGGGPLPPQFRARSMMSDPLLWWSQLQLINGAGYYSKYKKVVAGWELWVDWAFEAIPFAGGAIATAFLTIRSKTYCETCHKWLEMKKTTLRFVPVDDPAVIKHVEAGDLAPILNAPLRGTRAAAGPHYRVDYVLCNGCGNTGTYRIIAVNMNNEAKEKEVSSLMLLTAESAPILGLLNESEKSFSHEET